MITGNEIWGPSATREMGMRTIHGIEMFTFLDMPENLYEMLARTADKYLKNAGYMITGAIVRRMHPCNAG